MQLFLLLFTKALLVTAAGQFSLPLLPFPSAPLLPPDLASDKILSMPRRDCLFLSYLPFLIKRSTFPFSLLHNSASLTTGWYVLSHFPENALGKLLLLLLQNNPLHASHSPRTTSPQSSLEFPNENAVYF